jgi:xanthine/uracil permease
MSAFLTLRDAFWLLTTSVEIILLVYLFNRNLQPTHKAFTLSIAAAIFQSALAAWIYLYWGLGSQIASRVVWGSQGVVICLRFAAVFEMARRRLSQYQGIWALAKRVLFVISFAALAYALLVPKVRRFSTVIVLDRGLELAIAAFVVTLPLFARYYLLPVHPLDRAMALAFCLYSCFYVINDTLFEQFLGSYLVLWGYLDILTFLASLLIWIRAVKAFSPIPGALPGQQALPAGLYAELSPEFNFRLKHLNEQVSRLLHKRNPQG